jgi:NAD(P)-dependent dehydrogenase (short-subunit alcohol dehydrogenase family)
MNVDWLGIGGRVCVVSGAGGGIGRTIARGLAEVGGRIAIIDRDAETGEGTAAMIRASGGEAFAVACDITDPRSVEAARTMIEDRLGACEVLVNNAALVRNGALADLALADWNAVLNVNLTGFFICSQIFGRAMMARRGGSIIHVASLSGSLPQPTSGAYSVSKAGVLMLSKNLALEWGEKGVRSNVVSPAMVMTPMSEMIYRDPVVKAKREGVVPVRRIGETKDIADAICYLASDRSSYVSGQEIIVDGGWSVGMLAMVPRPGFDAAKKP